MNVCAGIQYVCVNTFARNVCIVCVCCATACTSVFFTGPTLQLYEGIIGTSESK